MFLVRIATLVSFQWTASRRRTIVNVLTQQLTTSYRAWVDCMTVAIISCIINVFNLEKDSEAALLFFHHIPQTTKSKAETTNPVQ